MKLTWPPKFKLWASNWSLLKWSKRTFLNLCKNWRRQLLKIIIFNNLSWTRQNLEWLINLKKQKYKKLRSRKDKSIKVWSKNNKIWYLKKLPKSNPKRPNQLRSPKKNTQILVKKLCWSSWKISSRSLRSKLLKNWLLTLKFNKICPVSTTGSI